MAPRSSLKDTDDANASRLQRSPQDLRVSRSYGGWARVVVVDELESVKGYNVGGDIKKVSREVMSSSSGRFTPAFSSFYFPYGESL